MSKASFTYSVSTMGCKANLTDSQALEAQLQELGGVALPEDTDAPDLMILNTCTVTDEADKEARKILQRSQAGFTIATGCLAQVDPAQLEAVPAKNFRVLKNSAKDELGAVVQEWLLGEEARHKLVHGDREAWHRKILPNHDPSALSGALGEKRTRAFYKVQDGCNAFCSYCVIPLARGRSRSIPAQQVVAELRKIVDSGVKEIVLTAIHAADYESDGLDFTGLVEKVLKETHVTRLRLTSLDPAEIPDRLLALMKADSRLCPHFHVSLQSANSRVLQGMKRAYGAEHVEERLLKIAAELPHAFVGMDVIAGFPGETEAEFADTLARLERLPWTKAHVFPFSVRRNTAAARLVENGLAVGAAEIKSRAAALRAVSTRKMQAALQEKVGKVMEVLIEEKPFLIGQRQCSQGYSRSYFRVVVPGRHAKNSLRPVRIVGVGDGDYLRGELQ